MRILATGGAGYIGSHVVAALCAAGHEPVVLDNLSSGRRDAIVGIQLVEADVTDLAAVRDVLERGHFDGAIHLAGLKSPFESLADPLRYFDVNVGGSLTLARAMLENDVPLLVYSSSCAVYGMPERLPLDEGCRTDPTTPYGESKLVTEQMLRWLSARGLRTASLRYFNAAGAAPDGSNGEDWTQAINLVPVVLKAALGAAPYVEVYGTDYPTGDGTAVRDYIHVVDLAEAHVRALEKLAGGGESFTVNLGTGTGTSVREVIAAAERAAGTRVPVRNAPRRAGDPAAVWADPALAEAVLGWQATRSIDEIVGSAVAWHRRAAVVGRGSGTGGT